jgi:ADP-ribosyl-[dinitrogen reductase] hydrolase
VPHLNAEQHDRSAAVLLGLACGDALGTSYEFGAPLPEGSPVSMQGGGWVNWAPGEWTNDTSMVVPIALAAAAGRDLLDESVLDDIVAQWVEWARSAPYVGIQLGAVLSRTEPMAAAVRLVARRHHDRDGRSAGNGSLLRTAAVALACLDDPATLAEAARTISGLTHYERDAGDACVLWGLAIRHAVLEGELDLRIGLGALPADRGDLWSARLGEAERKRPSEFPRNRWSVQALQGAWSSITHAGATEAGATDAGATDAGQFRLALEAAVRGGGDTGSVAAIAGGLLAARWGMAAIPGPWRRIVHGWPGLRGADLVRLAVVATRDRWAGRGAETRTVPLRVLRLVS